MPIIELENEHIVDLRLRPDLAIQNKEEKEEQTEKVASVYLECVNTAAT